MILTSPIMMRTRSIMRKLGLTKLITRLVPARKYEDKFGPSLISEIKRGDVVWDVGANVGLYTGLFLEAIGDQGKVVALEPVQACYEVVRKKFKNSTQIIVKNIAIGDIDGFVTMKIEDNPLAATHRIANDEGMADHRCVKVPVARIDTLVVSDHLPFPNVVKIDVEGHEGAVLDGMKPLLSDARLRCIGIEVHFKLLAERGEENRPRQIGRLLKSNGFDTHWVDPSHLIAKR